MKHVLQIVKKGWVLPICMALGACMTAPSVDTATRASTDAGPLLPPMKTFSQHSALRPSASNRDVARDFLDLAFKLESGRELPVLTRFEGPITLRVTGKAPISMTMDLDALLSRMRREAGLSITRTSAPNAAITIEAVTHAEIKRHLPQAACFVVPNVSSLAEYTRERRSGRTDWTQLNRRDRVAIFVPADAPPQEVRDCLHEELAQALGPLNDLYRLSDSVFNDDNVHTVLTGYDMMILRLFYAPELRSGMSRDQVARRLPPLLARINPAGENRAPMYLNETPRAWIDAIQNALGPGISPNTRRANAQRAVSIAAAQGWTDHRRGFAHYALGRVTQSQSPDVAMSHFLAADKYYRHSPSGPLHRAQVAQQLAAYAIHQGNGQQALTILEPHLSAASQHANAALLSTLMLLKAEALDLTARPTEARLVRLDSLGWARYGFGADWAVRAKLREITALSPLNKGTGQI